MTKTRTTRLLGALAAALCVCLAPHALPATAQPTRPSRIVSLVPAVTEMLFALGAGPAVVGVSSFDTFPPEVATRPKVGALIDPDFERILSLKPDLVVVYGSQDELIQRLARVNIPAFHYRHATLADVTQTIRDIGNRIGRAAEGMALAQRIEVDLDRVRASVAGRPRPRTALLFGREPGTLRSMYASAGVGFMHDLLVVAGGADVFDDVKRQSLQVTTEMLLARAPEVILEVHPSPAWTAARVATERKVWSPLASLPAVRTNRVQILADDRLVIPGPRVAEAARLMAEALSR